MILVLGYLGYRTNKLDGQTVKTRDLYRLLNECACEKVDFYDTEEYKYNKFSLLEMFWKVMRCKTLCYLPAHGNLKKVFPLIYFISVLFRVKIHYFVVGGWLDEYLKNLPRHCRKLARIEGIHVETHKLESSLKALYGFKNVDIFPNFRFFSYDVDKYDASAVSLNAETGKLNVAFVSRVEQSKGLDTLLKVAEILSSRGYIGKIVFDLYGQKRDDYFDAHMSGKPMLEYKGILQPDEVLNTLKSYDALIFPTHYDGEGCPGILVEALSVGLPIIASDWKYNAEFVEDGINGFLCQTFNAESYVNAIISLAESPDMRKDMARESYVKSRFFSVDEARELLNRIIS